MNARVVLLPMVITTSEPVRRIVTWYMFNSYHPRLEAALTIQRAYRKYRRNTKKLAFAMGSHNRLGKESVVLLMDGDLIAMIGRMI